MTFVPPKYPIKTQLPEITNHNHLPDGAVELARINDTDRTTLSYVFVKNAGYLSIVIPRYLHLKTRIDYFCVQCDFPMGFLPWFATALSNFQTPPTKGGLHTGAMSSDDQNVEGEMLCIERTMGSRGCNESGYNFVNLSRCDRSDYFDGEYMPQTLNLSEKFIKHSGLLDLIKDLAEKYQRGEI